MNQHADQIRMICVECSSLGGLAPADPIPQGWLELRIEVYDPGDPKDIWLAAFCTSACLKSFVVRTV